MQSSGQLVPYSGFFSSVLKFVLLLLRTNIFPHNNQRVCVGVWCMCARKRRKSIFFCAERKKHYTVCVPSIMCIVLDCELAQISGYNKRRASSSKATEERQQRAGGGGRGRWG